MIITGNHTFPFSPSLPFRRTTIKLTNYTHFPLPSYSRPFVMHRRSENLNFKVIAMQEKRMLEPEEAALLVSTCITRTLSPALTLEQGLQRLKEAVDQLKANPPCSSTGMFRFRVAVPPSTKSLHWFCCQPKSSGIFPQFFLSKEKENPSFKSLILGHTRGIFGIGAAINLKGFTASQEYGEFARFCAVESTPVVVYGFLDASFDTISSSLKHKAGSIYFFVPQIELEEFEGSSILSTTVAWSDSYICTFEEALHACESSLLQAEHNFCSIEDGCCSNRIAATLTEVHKKDGENTQMVYANLHKLFKRYLGPCTVELVSPLSWKKVHTIPVSSSPD